MNLDDYKIGDLVIARFTNSGHFKEFQGEIVGKTLNYWKVRSVEPVWDGEQPGRVFHIETLRSRRYSVNNCIARLVGEAR